MPEFNPEPTPNASKPPAESEGTREKPVYISTNQTVIKRVIDIFALVLTRFLTLSGHAIVVPKAGRLHVNSIGHLHRAHKCG